MTSVNLPSHSLRTLPTRHLGRSLRVFPRLDSTNTLALALATDPAHDGLVILAEEQTAGRGQYGRRWEATPRSSVLMSLLLFPPPSLRRPAVLVAWAAVAVCAAIRSCTGLDARIKWPNDVLVAGKKVCGVLIEQRTSGHAQWPLATVVGIGLNVTQPAGSFAAAGLPDAGSLFSLSGNMPALEDVTDRLIFALDDGYDGLLQGDFGTLGKYWRAGLDLVGQRVRIATIGQSLGGRLLDIGLEELAVEVAPGTVRRLAPEVVRHIDVEEGPPNTCSHPALGKSDKVSENPLI